VEGRVLLQCGDCDVTREIVGEIPDEYTRSFANAVEQDGWVPRPGRNNELICRACLAQYYEGHESVDDEEKVVGRRNPREL
jgi:CBS domain containing-hemolysin-like protein